MITALAVTDVLGVEDTVNVTRLDIVFFEDNDGDFVAVILGDAVIKLLPV